VSTDRCFPNGHELTLSVSVQHAGRREYFDPHDLRAVGRGGVHGLGREFVDVGGGVGRERLDDRLTLRAE
jgi:hypothetical protein